jgi:uncharacterized Zn-finger protein
VQYINYFVSMKKDDTVYTNSRTVSCDGGAGSLGHPKVWLEIKEEVNEAVCPYCGKHFRYDEKAAS